MIDSRRDGLKRQNLSQALSEEILERIRVGEWGPGDRLPSERKLMEQFKIGRNAVREGVQALVQLGVLDVRPGEGTTVLASQALLSNETMSAILSDRTIDELYELRLVIEVDAAGRAAERATQADLRAIEDALQRYRQAFESGETGSQYDVEFHRVVAQASQNELYTQVLESAADRLLAVRRETDKLPGLIDLAMRGHEEIAKSILRSDPRAARKAMHNHIGAARKALDGVRGRPPAAK
jgi:GntR family transcriptional repressor for pyruvate dehydrogenase complex